MQETRQQISTNRQKQATIWFNLTNFFLHKQLKNEENQIHRSQKQTQKVIQPSLLSMGCSTLERMRKTIVKKRMRTSKC